MPVLEAYECARAVNPAFPSRQLIAVMKVVAELEESFHHLLTFQVIAPIETDP